MKNKFAGITNVFKFSYMQTLKSKVFLVTIIIFCFVALIGLPIMTAISRIDKDEEQKTEKAEYIGKIYVCDEALEGKLAEKIIEIVNVSRQFEDGVFAVWRNAFDGKKDICEFEIDVFFEAEDGLYERVCETQTQKYHTHEEIMGCADGFTLLSRTGGKGFDGCKENEKEYYVFKKL
jgi:hypothetical protein